MSKLLQPQQFVCKYVWIGELDEVWEWIFLCQQFANHRDAGKHKYI